MIRTFSRTKIVATVGPACSSSEMLLELVKEGVNVFRLNFSHGTHEEHLQSINRIKGINKKYNYSVAILADLQGPKIRLGTVKDGVTVLPGDQLKLVTYDCVGNGQCVHINYQHFPRDVGKGDVVMIDDGKIELKVLGSNKKDEVVLEVVYGGRMTSNKGVNLPDTVISLPSLTKKDLRDLDFALKAEVDWLALSFVRSPDDILELRNIIRERGKQTKIISKIEKPQAVQRIDEILEVTDAIMIARGDLGVELPMETVPLIQKEIVNKCLKSAKPVIIATQMMESMIENARPTRAEIADVANAIMDGADAVMLSAETSVGSYPEIVIETIGKVIGAIESKDSIYNKKLVADRASPTFLSDAVCYNACELASDVEATAIIGMTRSGYTAFLLSSYRPKANIYIFTDNHKLLNSLSLVWGVRGFYYDKMVSTDDTMNDVHEILKEEGMIIKNDIVINTASMPIHRQARTNMVKITKID